MSTDNPPKAIVENCSLAASSQVAPDIQVTVYHIEARMLVPANKYSDDIYRIKIIKPKGARYLMPEDGTSMEHGRFSFDSTEEIPTGSELELEITPIA